MISGEVADIALHFDYKWGGNKKVLFRLGPMESVQGVEMLANAGDISKLFPIPEKSTALNEFISKVPKCFLYFDIDIFSEGDFDINEWPKFVSETAPYSIEMFEKFKDIILGK